MKRLQTINWQLDIQKSNVNAYQQFFRIALIAVFFCALGLPKAQAFEKEILETTQEVEQRQITGKVTENGEPLIGVTVLEKGTTNGAVTDLDGNYSISVADAGAVLVFSYTGYATQEVAVGADNMINVSLSTDAAILDEIVVVGYTTRKRGEVTGSVSTLGGEAIQKTANLDVTKSLAGKIPGLIISDRGGYPGSTNDLNVLIRGKSTLGNNNPLILVDGIPSASLSFLSPGDIESISVLKDGAAAIYGARAANGVILATTKRGKDGKPNFNFRSTYGISSFSNTPNLMSSEQYATYRNEAADRSLLPLPYTEDQIADFAANGPNTDWAEATFADSSPRARNTLSIRGGSDAVRYYISGDRIDETGLYKSGDLTFNQNQFRSNLDIKLHEKFSVGLDLAGQFGTRNEPGVPVGFIYKHVYTNEPTELSVNPDGSNAWGGENGANPLIMSSSESGFIKRKSKNLRSRVSFDWNLDKLADGLSVKGYTGIRDWNTTTKSWYTPWEVFLFQESTGDYAQQAGFSQQGTQNILRETAWEFQEIMLNGTLHYDKTFGAHTIRTFVGTEQFTSNTRTFFAERRDFPSTDVPELFAGSDEGQISSGGSSEFARLNYFGAFSYDYGKKYFLDVTLRRDGSGAFGPGNRFGNFPGVAVGWNIAEEAFMAPTRGYLDRLKLRASWAIMGNDRIAPFQWQSQYNYGGATQTAFPNYTTFGNPGVRYNGYESSTVPNPNITWETADMKNIGLSWSALNYKFKGDLNYFYQKRTDILIARNASIPQAAGLTLPLENLGEVDNFGFEAQLQWSDRIGKVNYSVGANFTQARNKVVFLDEAEDVAEGLKREGFSIDSYIVYPTNGVFRDQAQVDATDVVRQGTVEGEPIYLDTNEDGVIDAGDRIRIRSSNVPEVVYGIPLSFDYKGFDLNLLFQGQAGAEMLVFFDQSGALPEYVFNERWTPDNRDSRYPRAFNQGDPFSGNQNAAGNFQGADFWLHDASFLRLRELAVGYSFKKDQIKFGNLRVFFRGVNLATFFSEVYDLGLDPEAAQYDNFRGSTYPSLKSYTFGINLNFK